MPYLILNDLHFGLKREASMPAHALQRFYEDAQLATLLRILDQEPALPVVILGDLFDHGRPAYSVLAKLRDILARRQVTIVQGNHDITKDRSELSGAEFLADMLPGGVYICERRSLVDSNVAIVPHLANQELFDEAIAKASEWATTLLTHCNYENSFAVGKDHSLNLTREQAKKFETVVLGHEHNGRDIDNVKIIGSQFPLRADQVGPKRYAILQDDGSMKYKPAPFEIPAVTFDWRDPMPDLTGTVATLTGDATIDEAFEVVKLVAEIRNSSGAYMVTNKVVSQGVDLATLAGDSSESVETFDGVGAFWSALGDESREQLKLILGQG